MSGTPWTIRDAGPHEAGLLAAIIRDSFQDVAAQFHLTPENCPRHPSNCEPGWIDEGFAKGVRFFVLESADRPAGCVGMTSPAGGACELLRLAVPPAGRHNGFGRALVEHLIAQARASGLKRVDLAFIAAHDLLRRWYEALGFRMTGTRLVAYLPFELGFMSLDLARLCRSDSVEKELRSGRPKAQHEHCPTEEHEP
jgi:GNAT superfamily N-acetyltransferase